MTPRTRRTAVSRRTFLRGTLAGAVGVGAIAVVGCNDDDSKSASAANVAPPTQAPRPTAPASPATTRPAIWSPLAVADGPAPRRDHSLTYHPDDGLIYVFGGRAAGSATDELWTFNTKQPAWTRIQPASPRPEPRFGHNAFYDPAGKRVVIALGQGNDGAFFNDAWAFTAGAWTRLDAGADAPEIRYGAGGAHDAATNRLLISHGFTDQGRFDDTWAFDLATSTWSKTGTSKPLPVKRCLTRCLWLPSSKQLLMFGGQTDGTPFLGDLWKLDVASGKWNEEKPPTLPGPRNLYGASLHAASNRWYVTTGNTPDGPSAETWTYDIATDAWARIETQGDLPKRYSADAAFAGDKLYLFAGHNGDTEINDLWTLSL